MRRIHHISSGLGMSDCGRKVYKFRKGKVFRLMPAADLWGSVNCKMCLKHKPEHFRGGNE